MPSTQTLPPLRWFIFKHPERGTSCLGSFSRTEAEAVAEVRQRLQGGRHKTWPPSKIPTPPDAPTLVRDTEAEDKANAILYGHASRA